ncbi:hypothetical protein [Lyngbya confervoides]|uniref:Uncharacterized protein n=1 Tax=Lyngbya confervoides BDU141951 TaxID=1574623 RepID=A0ABD4SYW7_9CYAN|nr:hypothetical protein [Lyngbya confervoides]MCM1981267.1 hypothetical protein [Lyngbya confervoides BDU141951]
MLGLSKLGKRNRSRPRTLYEVCPVCRHGHLNAMALMETVSCSFCHHIFSLEVPPPPVQRPTLSIEDFPQSLRWQWTGDNWRSLPQVEMPLTLWLWAVALAIMILPPTLLGLAMAIVPVAAYSRGAWIPPFWMVATLIGHGWIGLWLLAEHYQWPWYTRLQIFWQRHGLLR